MHGRPARWRAAALVLLVVGQPLVVGLGRGSATPAHPIVMRRAGTPNREPQAALVGRWAASGAGARRTDASISGPELRRLASRAADDPAALEQLRQVRTVDGHPADLRAALAGASATALRARLAAMAAPSSTRAAADPAQPDPRVARAAARAVLDRRKYHPRRLPRPLQGVLRWLGSRLDPLFGPIGRAFRRLTSSLGGALLVAFTLVLLFAAVASRLVRGRSRAAMRAERRAQQSLIDRSADPDELDRRAAAAEADGDLDAALRLRYEAGLLRLHRAGVVEVRPDTTTGEAARGVDRPTFTALTATFEEVVYGGRRATEADLDAAGRGWVELLGVGAAR